MPLTPPTYQELVDNWRSVMEPLGVTNWSEGSRAGAMGKVISAYLKDLWDTVADVERQSTPSTAQGIYLDRLGMMFGVQRLPPQAASTVGRGPALQFTNNGATAIAVPASTRVWSATQPDVAFFTTQSITLAAGAQGYVDVIAGTAGEQHNVGVAVLTSHNAGMGQLSVTNVRPIGGGTFSESDESYRFRIAQSLQARAGATEGSIRQALLTVPGVRDALVRGGVRGAGSVDIMVIPVDRYPTQALMDAAGAMVADTVAAGISWRVIPPKTRRVDLTVQLRLAPGAELAQVQPRVEAAVRGYLDNLRVNDGNGGSDLIYNELVARVMDSSSDVVDTALNLTVDGTPTLQTNVTTAPGERIVSGAVTVT